MHLTLYSDSSSQQLYILLGYRELGNPAYFIYVGHWTQSDILSSHESGTE